MRVLFPYPGEFGYFPDIYEYVTLLRERGVDAHYAGRQQEASVSDRPPFVHYLPPGDGGKKRFIDFVSGRIAAIQPDIVHVFHFRGCGALPLTAGQPAAKWIVDVRTIHVETKALKIAPGFWLRDRLTWIETQTYDRILALTTTIQRRLWPSLRPIDIVPLGASHSRLNSTGKDLLRAQARAQLEIAADDVVVLYAGSLSPTRQLDKVVAGFARVLDSYPQARLLVVGGTAGYDPATDPLIVSLRRQAQESGIFSHVIFTGRVPYLEISRYFAAADIGISYMPGGTPHQFQPPTKLIEYMMAGLVAASNRTPAVAGLLDDNVNGILFGESVTEIASGLRRSLALLNPESRTAYQRVTTNARRTVRDRDWQHIVSEHLVPLYEKLCGSER